MEELCSPEVELYKLIHNSSASAASKLIGSETVDIVGEGGTWLVDNVGAMLTMEERDWFCLQHFPRPSSFPLAFVLGNTRPYEMGEKGGEGKRRRKEEGEKKRKGEEIGSIWGFISYFHVLFAHFWQWQLTFSSSPYENTLFIYWNVKSDSINEKVIFSVLDFFAISDVIYVKMQKYIYGLSTIQAYGIT